MPNKKPKRGSNRRAHGKASKRGRSAAVAYVPQVLQKPEGDLQMMIAQMQDAELQAQVQAETAVKLRSRIVRWTREKRLAGNIPVENVAAAIGRHKVSLTRIELGVVSARDSTLQALLAFYGIEYTPIARFFTSEPKISKRRTE